MYDEISIHEMRNAAQKDPSPFLMAIPEGSAVVGNTGPSKSHGRNRGLAGAVRTTPRGGALPDAPWPLLAVVDGRQFLELRQRAQRRGLCFTGTASTGSQSDGGHCYSGEGGQLNELLHRKCVLMGSAEHSGEGTPITRQKSSPRPQFSQRWSRCRRMLSLRKPFARPPRRRGKSGATRTKPEWQGHEDGGCIPRPNLLLIRVTRVPLEAQGPA